MVEEFEKDAQHAMYLNDNNWTHTEIKEQKEKFRTRLTQMIIQVEKDLEGKKVRENTHNDTPSTARTWQTEVNDGFNQGIDLALTTLKEIRQ